MTESDSGQLGQVENNHNNQGDKLAHSKQDKYTLHAAAAEEARATALVEVNALVEARDNLDDIKASARAGESVTALDLATAHAGVELAELRVLGADARARRAHENPPFDPVIAQTVADILGKAWGIPSHVVEKVPTKPEVPALYIVQEKAAKNDGGALSATVDMTYSRAPLYRGLTGQDFRNALEPYGSILGGDVQTFDNRTRVTFTGEPVIPFSGIDPQDKATLQRVARLVASRYVGGLDRGANTIATTTEGDVRTLEVRATVATNEADANRAKGLVGVTTPLGRIVKAEQVASDSHVTVAYGGASYRQGGSVTVELTIESTSTPHLHATAPEAYEPVVHVVNGCVEVAA